MHRVSISTAGLRIMKLLVGNEPQTIADLTGAAGVTRTAVTEQLSELVASGFVERAPQRRHGRGRPRHLYQATSAALLLLFAGNQRLVVPAIRQAIRALGGEELNQKVLKRVSRALADHYNNQITAKKPRERLRKYIDLLMAEGALIEVVENGDGHLKLYKRTCPFISMIDQERTVCRIDQEMLRAVVGRPVRQTACRHDGDPCCAFELVDQ